MKTKRGRDLGDHVLSGNFKDGFLLICKYCGKEWFNKIPNKNCSDECYRESCRKQLKENNPLHNPEIREKQRIANGTKECREKKRKYTSENNPMNKPEIKEKHKKKMKEMSGEKNPLYTNPNALENLRNSAKSEECRKKKSDSTKQSFIDGKHPMCFEEIRLKVSKSNSKPYDLIKGYREYNIIVNQETRRSLIKHKKDILNYELRGKKHGYELDHKYSIYEGFTNNIDPKIIGHWKNLEIITRVENDIKYTKCSISLEELLKLIKENEVLNE